MKVFDQTLSTLERALDVRLGRQNVLAGNLANADTPGFVPRDVDFAAAMSGAAADRPALPTADRPGDLPLASPAATGAGPADLPITSAAGASPGIDGNAVDADRALVALAENALSYGAVARAAGKKLAILRYVASDGLV
jgi:flagellar basal-body rod protein FlgB